MLNPEYLTLEFDKTDSFDLLHIPESVLHLKIKGGLIDVTNSGPMKNFTSLCLQLPMLENVSKIGSIIIASGWL